MYHDHTPLQAAGQLLLAFAFLATGIRNAGWKFQQHLERMAANGVPRAKTVLSVWMIQNCHCIESAPAAKSPVPQVPAACHCRA